MTPEQSAKYRYWKTTLNHLLIGDTRAHDGVSVTRLGNNRFSVTMNDGVTLEIGGRQTRLVTAITRTLSVIRVNTIDGEREEELCTRCQVECRQPGRNYCTRCEKALDSTYNRKRYLKLKAEKRTA